MKNYNICNIIIFLLLFSSTSWALKKNSQNTRSTVNESSSLKTYFSKFKGCRGGTGFAFYGFNKYYKHTFQDFRKKYSCANFESLLERSKQQMEQAKQIFKKNIKSFHPDCVWLNETAKKYINDVKGVEELNRNIMKDAIENEKFFVDENISDNYNLKGAKAPLCLNAALARDYSTYVALENEVGNYYAEKNKESKLHTKVLKDNSSAYGCHSLTANGYDGINQFSVQSRGLKSDVLNITYNHFDVPDQLIISVGSKIIFDSGCTATSSPVSESVKGLESNFTVKVTGNCNGNPQNAKGWSLSLNCNETIQKELPQKNKSYQLCESEAIRFNQSIEPVKKSITLTMDAYFAQLDCFLESHQTLVNDFIYAVKPRYFPVSIYENNLLQAMINNEREASKFKALDFKGIKETKQISKQNIKKQLPQYNEFFMNRFKYCGKRPPKDGNLFKRISFSYCFYGYLRLFDRGHPIYAD